MGLLDRAKKLAEQAKDLAEDAVSEMNAKRDTPAAATSSSAPGNAQLGTPYTPGMLSRPGWREEGLTDPAAVLPAGARDQAGVPRSTRSEIVEEPFGMGRRWTSAGRSAALLYQIYPEQRAWEPPNGGTTTGKAALPDGRTLVFLDHSGVHVVLETSGLDAAAQSDLASAVAGQLEGA